MAVRLFVGNLSYATTEADLRTYFGAVAPRYVWTFQGHQILALKGSDIPMLLLLVAVLLRLALRLPDAVAGREGAALVDAVRDGRFPPAFWIGMLWIAIGVLGSFGLNGFFHTFLYGRVQAFQSLRVPARWAMIAYVGLSLTAASLPSGKPEDVGFSSERLQRISELVQRCIDSAQISGAVTMVARKGRVAL